MEGPASGYVLGGLRLVAATALASHAIVELPLTAAFKKAAVGMLAAAVLSYFLQLLR